MLTFSLGMVTGVLIVVIVWAAVISIMEHDTPTD